MRFAYALCESKNQGTIGQWYEAMQVEPVDPLRKPMDELKRDLRPWALSILRAEGARDGWYAAFLVEMARDGQFDAYDPLHAEEVVWCYETEYVPRE